MKIKHKKIEYELQQKEYLAYLQHEEGKALNTYQKVKISAEITRLQILIDRIDALSPHHVNKEVSEAELHLTSKAVRAIKKKQKPLPKIETTWMPSN